MSGSLLWEGLAGSSWLKAHRNLEAQTLPSNPEELSGLAHPIPVHQASAASTASGQCVVFGPPGQAPAAPASPFSRPGRHGVSLWYGLGPLCWSVTAHTEALAEFGQQRPSSLSTDRETRQGPVGSWAHKPFCIPRFLLFMD